MIVEAEKLEVLYEPKKNMYYKDISSKEKVWDEIAFAISADGSVNNFITNILQVKYRHIMNKNRKVV